MSDGREVRAAGKTSAVLVQDEYAQRVVALHKAAEAHASSSVFCVAIAGAVMIQKKKAMGHGRGWSAWLNNLVLPDGRIISASTAKRYMALARVMADRFKALPKRSRVTVLPEKAHKQGLSAKSGVELLASLDPAGANDLRIEAVREAVRNITDEQSLRQLYFSWGIVKQPKKIGGHHPRKNPALTDEEALAAQKKAAREDWRATCDFLERQGVRDCTWGLLPVADREALLGLLDEIGEKIRRSM